MTTPQGKHTGALKHTLALADLTKPGTGCWAGRVKWNKSSLSTFQGQPALRVFYKAGSGTSADPHHDASGMSVHCCHSCIKGAKAAVVCFEVFFDPASWHWSRGGKLGGLFVGEGAASGGRHTATGSSHRIMWQADGGAISYIYPPAGLAQPNPVLAKGADYGVGLHHATFAKALKPGQWNHVELGIKLNSFGPDGKPAGDGKAMLCVNGVSAVTDRINWSANPGMVLDKFEYTTFFGGPDPAVVDSVSYVRNFAVREWRE